MEDLSALHDDDGDGGDHNDLQEVDHAPHDNGHEVRSEDEVTRARGPVRVGVAVEEYTGQS